MTLEGKTIGKPLNVLGSSGIRVVNRFRLSLERQAEVLNNNGILFHSFWYGDKEEEHVGMRFVYYTPETLRQLIGQQYDVLALEHYDEMGENDSLYLMLRKK